jgi:hypothetical protein
VGSRIDLLDKLQSAIAKARLRRSGSGGVGGGVGPSADKVVAAMTLRAVSTGVEMVRAEPGGPG